MENFSIYKPKKKLLETTFPWKIFSSSLINSHPGEQKFSTKATFINANFATIEIGKTIQKFFYRENATNF
jgi:hypothetical protein